MIGQTVVNVKIGQARTRVSTVVAALALLTLVTALSDLMPGFRWWGWPP